MAELKSTSGEGDPDRSPSNGQWTNDDRRAWLDFARDVGLENIKAQREELSGMRQRAIMFVAFTVTASGFLVGTGLSAAQRPDAFYWLAGLGTLLFVMLGVVLVLLVAPFMKFQFSLEPDALVRWMEGEHPAPSRQIASRQLATQTIPRQIKENREQLRVARNLYRGVLTSALATLGCWVLVVWLFG
jgi:hypothetical protein